MKFIKVIKAEQNNENQFNSIQIDHSLSPKEAADELCKIYDNADKNNNRELLDALNDAYWYSWELEDYQDYFPKENFKTHEEAFEWARGSDGLSPLSDLVWDHKNLPNDDPYGLHQIYLALDNFI